jgi:hypothetical protein
MATIYMLADTVRPSVDHRLDDTAFGAGTFSWQDPVHSWKAGPETVEKQKQIIITKYYSSFNIFMLRPL